MAQYVTTGQLNGLFKEAYPDGVKNLVPEKAIFQKLIGDLSETEKVGNKYHQPVILNLEQGYTYGGPASTAGAFALNAAIAMQTQDAQIEGSEGELPSQIALGALSKSANGGAKAFKKAFSVVLEANLTSHSIRKELETLYGLSASGIGRTLGADNNVSGTSTTMNIDPLYWAPGIWAGMEGAQIAVYRNDTGAIAGTADTQADRVFTISAVDTDNKKITVTGSTTGITRLDTAAGASVCNIAFYGARAVGSGAVFATSPVESPGLDYALTLAAGNTLWNVSTNYTLFRGTTYSCSSGAATLGKVLGGIQKAVGKAGLDEEVALMVATDTWPNMADSFSAARVLDSSYSSSEGKNGVEKLTYVGANGIIRVVPHPCIKSGEAYAVPVKRCKKVGSTDVTLNLPGRGDEIFVLVQGVSAVEFRSYSDWAFFVDAPAKCVKYTSIVNY